MNNIAANVLLPLQIHKVCFSIKKQSLLNNINATVTSAGICIIMGHNGAGKSLLLKCLHGLLSPTTGNVDWAGNNAQLVSTRQKQAMVFQKPLMLNRSVEANIHYVLKHRGLSKDLCMQYLHSANLESKSNQPARSLSGGEQQRLAIARTLASNPSVLFLDEPTANLDPEATNHIEAQIKSASNDGIKIIMVTHDVGQARRLAEEILFLNSGRLTEHTNSEQFFNQPQSIEAKDFLAAYTG